MSAEQSQTGWRQQWEQWQARINALNLRERVLVMVTAVVAVVMLMQLLLIDPVLAERKRDKARIDALRQNLQQQRNQRQILRAELEAGVNRRKEQQLAELTEQRDALDTEIRESVVAMIPPRLMPEVLESILAQNKELKLIRLENKPVVPVLEQGDDKDPEAASGAGADTAGGEKQGLYSHGFVLTLSGNYRAAIRYFEELSALPWRFYWDDLHYQVDGYPGATITLEVHTVSMSEEWIGV